MSRAREDRRVGNPTAWIADGDLLKEAGKNRLGLQRARLVGDPMSVSEADLNDATAPIMGVRESSGDLFDL